MKKPDPKKSGGKTANTNNSKKKNEKEQEPEIDDSGPHIFEVLQESVKKNYIDESKREKALLLNYTIAIIKPNTISISKNCRIIVDKIEKENFEIFDIKMKYLTREEITNLYYKQTSKEYFEEIVEYMMSGPVAILVLINKNESYVDPNGIPTLYASPVVRWKEFIGHKDPAQSKTTNPNCLRFLYGTDIIRNEFWGSDTPSDAYRELSIFMIPLPCRPPVFVFDQNKINQGTIMNFLFPVKPNHPDVCGRLDMLSKYGPVSNYHILDQCICKECRPKIKNILKEEGKTMKQNRDKLVTDELIHKHSKEFCFLCLQHFNAWSHLYSGFEQTHIMTNEEIDFLIYEMNKEDLLTILKSEKGSSAETILSKVNIKEPPSEIQYTSKHIEKLLKSADVDYYDRYDFYELQNLILEDRRIRLNFWVHTIIGKPPEAFKNPKLLNTGQFSAEDMKNINSLKHKNFTLLRTSPITVKNEEEEKLKVLLIENPIFLKDKLTDHEINVKIEKLMSKNFSKVSSLEAKNDKNMVSNMILLRNYELETLKENKDMQTINKMLTNKKK